MTPSAATSIYRMKGRSSSYGASRDWPPPPPQAPPLGFWKPAHQAPPQPKAWGLQWTAPPSPPPSVILALKHPPFLNLLPPSSNQEPPLPSIQNTRPTNPSTAPSPARPTGQSPTPSSSTALPACWICRCHTVIVKLTPEYTRLSFKRNIHGFHWSTITKSDSINHNYQ